MDIPLNVGTVAPGRYGAEAAEVFSRGFLSGWLGGGDSQGSPPWNLTHTHTHPTRNIPVTSAEWLHERICFAGQSAHWPSIFRRSADPTFLLLCTLWHAICCWDEAFQRLNEHMIALECRVSNTAAKPLVKELHILSAHYQRYSFLLDDLPRTISFIKEAANPFMTEANFPVDRVEENKTMLRQSCQTLSVEVERLRSDLLQQQGRVNNLIALTNTGFVIKTAEGTFRDSTAMKQVAYLSTIFLPASFVASVFGMNVAEISSGAKASLWHYVLVALFFTILTILVIASQNGYIVTSDTPFWMCLIRRPFELLYEWWLNSTFRIRRRRTTPTEVTLAF